MQIHRSAAPRPPKTDHVRTGDARTHRRRGFTLVEMMVVIALIAILIAVLAPALVVSIESARQVACQNNLRMQGVAILAYESSHRHYPTGGAQSYTDGPVWPPIMPPQGSHSTEPRDHHLVDRSECGSTPCDDQTWGWQYQILNYLEDANNKLLYNERNPAVIRGSVVNAYHCPSAPAETVHIRNKSFLDEVQIDGLPLGAFGGTDYAGNIGVGSATSFGPLVVGCGSSPPSIDENKAGPFVPRGGKVTPASVTDGPGHTILVGEAYADPAHVGEAYHGHVVGFVGGWAETNSCGITQYFPTDTLRMVTDLFGPNVSPPGRGNIDLHQFEAFGSWHPGTAFFLMGNGSVREISTGVDRDLFKRLGTMSGDELIDGTEF